MGSAAALCSPGPPNPPNHATQLPPPAPHATVPRGTPTWAQSPQRGCGAEFWVGCDTQVSALRSATESPG